MRYPSNRAAWIATLCCALVVAILPKFITNNYSLGVLAFMAISVILAVGLNLLMGYAGQVSLGHAAFFGMGAYVSAILTTLPHPISPWLAMLAGVIFTSAVAFVIGIPCLRLKGHYLAMATLGFGWIVYLVLVHWQQVTQGASGIESIPKLTIGSLVLWDDPSHYYLTWGFALLILLISANVVNSRVGRALRAVHGSEMAAASLGVDISSYKIQVFVLSAAYASIAGSLYAHTVYYINPSSFGFTFSVELVVMVVIGGMASVWGALFGAGTITLLAEWLRSLGEAFPFFKDFDVIAHGAILILVMIFLPSGLTCGAQDLVMHFIRRRRKPATPAAPKPEEVAVP